MGVDAPLPSRNIILDKTLSLAIGVLTEGTKPIIIIISERKLTRSRVHPGPGTDELPLV